jgi:cytochrome c biogenesis protein CcmG/thiol:disulfide interchange protein DsbE
MAGRAKLVAQGIAVAGVVALLGLLVWKVAFESSGGAAEQLARGETPPAPAFTLERLDSDGTLSLASLRGKAVVLNFWASWCIPCKDEAPLLEEAWQEHRDRGLVVLGVDAQDFKGDARKFMSRYGLTYPVVHDGKGSTLGRYGITGFPETFFVDRRGNLVGERLVGGLDLERNREKFQQGIELALGGAGADGSGSAP